MQMTKNEEKQSHMALHDSILDKFVMYQLENCIWLQLKRLISTESLTNLLPAMTFSKVLIGGSRTAATSKIERFVIIVNGWKPLTIITKRSILDVAAALDPPLMLVLCQIKCQL